MLDHLKFLSLLFFEKELTGKNFKIDLFYWVVGKPEFCESFLVRFIFRISYGYIKRESCFSDLIMRQQKIVPKTT